MAYNHRGAASARAGAAHVHIDNCPPGALCFVCVTVLHVPAPEPVHLHVNGSCE